MAADTRQIEELLAHLRETLGADGWWIRRTKNGVRARWRWLSVSLKYHPEIDASAPWRARLRDGLPRRTVAEYWGADPRGTLDTAISHARTVRRFVDGPLVRNPSKGWLAHRLWEAVRPPVE